MKIAFSAGARSDLLDTVSFYRTESPALAASFMAEIDRALAALAFQPRIGSPLGSQFRRLVLRRFPHSLIYRVEPSVLYVIAVAHQRRRPDYWRKRMQSEER